MASEKIYKLITKILSESASEMEKEQFGNWLTESEKNQQEFEAIKILWTKLESTYESETFDKEQAKKAIRYKIAEYQKTVFIRRKQIRWIGYAATIALFLSFGLAYLFFPIKVYDPIAYNSKETIRQILLPDSSIVWLNKNSTLIAPKTFSSKKRKVLLKGEAYFEVKRNPEKPFIIQTGKTITKVLGTSFNIAEKNNTITVSVKSGRVAYYQKHFPWHKKILTADLMATYDNKKNKLSTPEATHPNFLAWKTKKLIFNNTPLNEACSILSDFYGHTILSSISDTGIYLSGSFNNEPLEDILPTIELTLDIKTKNENGKIIFINP